MANSEYWTVKGNVSNAQMKVLWERAVAAKLLASQIVLDADQVNISGTTIFTGNKIAKNLGYTDSSEMEEKAKAGQTIIDGGHLRTSLIEVEELLAKNITVRGSMQSTNYRPGISGWKINGNGQAEFEDGVFRGEVNATQGVFEHVLVLSNSIFKGDIISGPLILNNTNPSRIQDVHTFKAGSSSENLYNYIVSNGGSFNVDGRVISRNGYTVSVSYISIRRNWNGVEMICRDKDYNKITKLAWWKDTRYDDCITLKEISYGKFVSLEATVELGVYNPEGKTFKLINLPTNKPIEKGAIWVDSGNYLRINR